MDAVPDTYQQPSTAIVILNWNGFQKTRKCLDGLEHIQKKYQIYVVDNGSTDDSGDRIREEFDWCEVLFTGENLGFAGGCNVGIRKALDDGMEHVVLLNNDTIINNDFVAPLTRTAESHEDVAIVGGIIKDAHTDEIWYAGGQIRPAFVKGIRVTEAQSDEPYETEHVIGALMLLTRGFIEKHGMLDENYFFGIEDTDISVRARENGWKVMVNPNSKIKHDVSSTAGSGSPFKYYHAARNRLYFAKRHLTMSQQVVFYLFFFATRVLRFAQWAPDQTPHIKATLHGVSDYVFNRPHRKPEEFGIDK